MTSPVEIQDVANYSARLGTLAWWDLHETKIAPDHLQAILDREGIQVEVDKIDAISAIRRACSGWASGKGNADRYRAEVVSIEDITGAAVLTANARPANAPAIRTVFVGILTHRKDKANRENGWDQVELLQYDATTHGWIGTPSTMARAFVDLANDMIAYHDHRWIRRNVIQPELTAMKVCEMRRQGGIYFVPAEYLDRLRHLKRAIQAIGRSDMHLAAIQNDEDGRASVSAGLRLSLLDEVDVVEARIAEWAEAGKKPRTDAHANTIGELNDLANRAELYEGILAMRLDDLRAKIALAKDAAVALVTQAA